MRATFHILFIAWFFAITTAKGEQELGKTSPNKKFETYTTPRNPDCTGAQFFIRAAGATEPGALLLKNDRWIEAVWSPDSRFLAVVDGSDGHVTDIFVYRILPCRGTASKVAYSDFYGLGDIATYAEAPGVAADLCYHSPNPWTYDVKWDVKGWDSRHTIILSKWSLREKTKIFRVVLDASSSGESSKHAP
jgi:hypothetical protein